MRQGNFKIVIILSDGGTESVTVHSSDDALRKIAYGICQKLEMPLKTLSRVVEEESKKRIRIGGISNE
jgi:hypothetical protein